MDYPQMGVPIFPSVNVVDSGKTGQFAAENLKLSLAVGSPEHYTKGSIEAIDYIKASMTKEQYTGFLLGNVKKYIHRYQYKGEPVKDLMKAAWYLDRLIKEVKDAT